MWAEEMEVFLCQRLLDQNLPISERFRALFSLLNLKGPASRDALISATRDSSNLLAHEAAFALGQMLDADVSRALKAVLNDHFLHPIVHHKLKICSAVSHAASLFKSPFMFVDPAAPAPLSSSISQLRDLLLDEEKAMYGRYAALFALRNDGGDEAVRAIIDSLGVNSDLCQELRNYACDLPVGLPMQNFTQLWG